MLSSGMLRTLYYKNHAGLSIAELIVVVSIVTILAALSWTTFTQFTNFHAVDKEVGVAVSTLAYTRSQSMSAKNDSMYGIHFASTSTTIFKGATYSAADANNVTRVFSNGIIISAITLTNGATDVTFDKLSGAASASGTVEFSSSRDQTKKQIIKIYGTGLVDSYLVAVPIATATSTAPIGSIGSPAWLATIPVCTSTRRLRAIDGYLYIVCQNSLQIIDISNPSLPKILSTTTNMMPGAYQQYLAVSGNYAYVTVDNLNQLDVYDISNKLAPTRVAQVSTGSWPVSVEILGSYAYLINRDTNTLQTIDISNPSSPVILSTVTTTNYPTSLIVSSQYLYVFGQQWHGDYGMLQVFSLSNPATPLAVGITPINTLAINVNMGYLANGLVYALPGGLGAMQITNVSSSTAPYVVYSQPGNTIRNGNGMTGKNTYLYIAHFNAWSYPTYGTLQVYSIASSTLPAFVKSIDIPLSDGQPIDVSVLGSYLYLLNNTENQQGTLEVYSLGSNP